MGLMSGRGSCSMRTIVIAMVAIFTLVGMAACAGGQSGSDTIPPSQEIGAEEDVTNEATTQTDAPATLEQTGWTAPVPAVYLESSDEPGSVERIDYDSIDYVGNGGAITKTAYVYTPAGYDEDGSERYGWPSATTRTTSATSFP